MVAPAPEAIQPHPTYRDKWRQMIQDKISGQTPKESSPKPMPKLPTGAAITMTAKS
jgi:hypothetical protein